MTMSRHQRLRLLPSFTSAFSAAEAGVAGKINPIVNKGRQCPAALGCAVAGGSSAAATVLPSCCASVLLFTRLQSSDSRERQERKARARHTRDDDDHDDDADHLQMLLQPLLPDAGFTASSRV